MNCRQARSLFSARIDRELTASELLEHQRHLDICLRGCAERWTAFEATVRLVHDLPPVEANPAFVGQVLDRVRAYEAGQLRPQRVRPQRARRRVSLGWRLREMAASAREWVLPAPARLATVAVLGLLAGFVLASSRDWPVFSGADGTSGVAAQRQDARSTGQATRVPAERVRPFADFAEELAAARGLSGGSDTTAMTGESPFSGTSAWPVELSAPSRQVNTQMSDGRPRITF